MAWMQYGPFESYPAAADLSAKQFTAVVLNSSALLESAGADERIIGILIDDPLAGEAGTVQTRDVCKAKAGGTFSAGDPLTTNADGELVAAVATDHIVARARGAGVDGRVVPVHIGYEGVL